MRPEDEERARTADNERQIVDAFRGKRATSRKAAKRLPDLGLNDSRALRAMVATLVLRRAGADRYFLDETVWAARRGLRGVTALRLAAFFGLAAAAVLLFAWTR